MSPPSIKRPSARTDAHDASRPAWIGLGSDVFGQEDLFIPPGLSAIRPAEIASGEALPPGPCLAAGP
jgi:hypothetical protein